MEKDDIFEELQSNFGAVTANRFVDLYSGSNIYIPQRIKTKQIYRKIRDEFKNGVNYRELSFKYGYCERHIRTIIHERRRGSSKG